VPWAPGRAARKPFVLPVIPLPVIPLPVLAAALVAAALLTWIASACPARQVLRLPPIRAYRDA
jgi:ABC-type lipoprotein release transport system permease subunit